MYIKLRVVLSRVNSYKFKLTNQDQDKDLFKPFYAIKNTPRIFLFQKNLINQNLVQKSTNGLS